MMWFLIGELSLWLASPTGNNAVFLALALLAILGLDGRKVALLALMIHLTILVG